MMKQKKPNTVAKKKALFRREKEGHQREKKKTGSCGERTGQPDSCCGKRCDVVSVKEGKKGSKDREKRGRKNHDVRRRPPFLPLRRQTCF